MYERFTDRARKVMQLANQEAQRLNHEYIGTEHILLGLVREGTGTAANVLKNLDIDLRKVRLEVEKIVQSGPDMVSMGKLPQTPRAKKVIEYAIEEARNLKHNYVGTEHVLLGLLREEEGVAAQVLMNLGLKLRDVREEILRVLGYLPDSLSYSLEFRLKPFDADRALLPASVQAVLKRIDVLNQEKEAAVAEQDFEKAAFLRDLADKLKKCMIEIYSETTSLCFTARARMVLQLANQDAQIFGSESIDVEHLLLGLAMEHLLCELKRYPTGVASRAFEQYGIDVRKVYLEMLRHVVATSPPAAPIVREKRLTDRARNVIGSAAEEARRCQLAKVGTGFLLLGLLREEGAAAQVLLGLGLKLEEVRAKVLELSKSKVVEKPGDKVEPTLVLSPETSLACQELDDQLNKLDGEILPAIRASDFKKAAQLIDEINKLLKQRASLAGQ